MNNTNFIDKVVGFFSPTAAVTRKQARQKLEGSTGSRKYDGAAKGRNVEDWMSNGASANVEVQTDLITLRNRSRELHRNNAYVKNWLRIMPNNIVGTGIIPSPYVMGNRKAVTNKTQADNVKEVWKMWAEDVCCDYDQRYDFYGLQHLVAKTIFMSGECLIVRRKASSKYDIPLRLQVLECDLIYTGKYSLENEYGGITWYGIEFNKAGERVGYWLWDRHPGEFATKTFRVDAADVCHVYNAERPGQMRGVPEMHAAMIAIKDLGDYQYAERLRAKIASCFVGVINQDDVETEDPNVSPYATMEPGTFHKIKKGEGVTFNTVPTSNGYSEYVKNNLHGISAAGGTTYEAMTGDLSNTNFSSGRMGWLEFHRNIEFWQNNILKPFNNKMFDWFVEAAQVAGELPLNAKIKAKWTPPRREMIDPYKEGKALGEAVRNKFMTWSEAVMERGDNPEDVIAKLSEEHKMMVVQGLKPESFPEFDADRMAKGSPKADAGAMKD